MEQSLVELEITIDPYNHCKDVTLDPSLWDEYSNDRYDIDKYDKTNSSIETPTHRLLFPMKFSTFAQQDSRELPMKIMTATNPVRIVKNMITVFGGGGGASTEPAHPNPYIKSFGLMKTFYAMWVVHLICWAMYMILSVMR